jgi:molybdopterin/thiamine biosynthesis adenylyltransferase
MHRSGNADAEVGIVMKRLDRQSFLGGDSDDVLGAAIAGLVGLGGGGSHHAQQLAHVGVGGFVLVDPDTIDLSNTNRMVGGTLADVEADLPKVEIAARVIRGVQPDARIKALKSDWRLVLDDLKDCDVLLGAVDSFRDRDQLERFARRFLIPYVDIGMDVLPLPDQQFLISGQVILSMPGGPCLRCCNFITDERLEREAERYGAAGGRPQVVWPNGVLASTAVGIVLELLTPWHRARSAFVYMEYDGNRRTVSPSYWMNVLEHHACPHYPRAETGDPGFDARLHLAVRGGTATPRAN